MGGIVITRVEGEPCWWFRYGDDEEGPHFPTREAAENALGMPAGGVLEQLTVPCWLALCSTDDCDGCEGDEDGDPGHIPARKAQHVLAELGELTLDRGRLICPDCVEKAKPPAPPIGARPSIVTYDEIARVFGLLVQLRKRLPGYLPLEPVDQDVLTKVESLVGHHPTGAGRELAYVHPFAVQPPLPDMPPVSITTAGSLR